MRSRGSRIVEWCRKPVPMRSCVAAPIQSTPYHSSPSSPSTLETTRTGALWPRVRSRVSELTDGQRRRLPPPATRPGRPMEATFGGPSGSARSAASSSVDGVPTGPTAAAATRPTRSSRGTQTSSCPRAIVRRRRMRVQRGSHAAGPPSVASKGVATWFAVHCASRGSARALPSGSSEVPSRAPAPSSHRRLDVARCQDPVTDCTPMSSADQPCGYPAARARWGQFLLCRQTPRPVCEEPYRQAERPNLVSQGRGRRAQWCRPQCRSQRTRRRRR